MPLQRKPAVIITCEHGGNKVPKSLRVLFENAKSVLQSHRGWDIGILPISREITKILKADLHFSEISRLVVDLNRSLSHPSVFSQWTQSLTEGRQRDLIEQYYIPYRDPIETKIRRLVRKKTPVYHLSMHSFTARLNGQQRKCEIGILYDPSHETEALFAHRLKRILKVVLPDLRVRLNYPYRGTSNSFTTDMRKAVSGSYYRGIEIEINQSFLSALENRNSTKIFAQHLAWALEGAVRDET